MTDERIRDDIRCCDCGAPTPPVDPEHTLISAHGWRSIRTFDETGRRVLEWRCPVCWKAYRRQREQ